MENQQQNNAELLIPEWTIEDFSTEKPYAWLYEQKDNKFLLQILVNKTLIRAKRLGFVGFTKMWNAYEKSQSPKQTVLGNNQTVFPDQPVQLQCGAYVADEYGVATIGRSGEEIEVCSHPIMPVKRLRDVETRTESLEIAWCRGVSESGKPQWKNDVFSKDVLASSKRITDVLSKRGIAVNDTNAKLLAKYITDIESWNYNNIPTQETVSHLGWVNGSFVPYDDNPICDTDCGFSEMQSAVQSKGNYEIWKTTVRAYRTAEEKNLPFRIMLAASFAAPLIELLELLPFFVNCIGEKDSGKSVSLAGAASVWAIPIIGKWIQTFNTTDYAFLNRAAFAYSLPVCLDERQTQVGAKSEEKLQEFIYTFCNGTGRDQGTKNGGNKEKKNWHTIALTTGEQELTSWNSKAGSLIRVIDVPFSPGSKMFTTGSEAATFVETITENYGFAGADYIRQLKMEDRAKLKEKLNAYRSELGENAAGKQANAAAALLLADELATKYIFHDDMAIHASDIAQFLKTEAETDTNARIYQALSDWLISNKARFVGSGAAIRDPLLGKVEGDTFFVLKSEFSKFLQMNNFSEKLFVRWGIHNGVIVDHATAKDRYHHTMQMRIMDNRVTVWEIKQGITINGEGPEKDDSIPPSSQMIPVKIPNDDLPF